MAAQVMRPGFIDYIEQVSRSFGRMFSLEEVQINADSPLSGKRIIDTDFRKLSEGAMIMAV